MSDNKTYHHLYWDREFVEKRIQEQNEYIQNYKSTVDKESRDVLRSAFHVLIRFQRQLENIKKLKPT